MPPGKGITVKLELRINGTVLVFESAGAVSLHLRDDSSGGAVPALPPEQEEPPAPPSDDGLFAQLADLRRQLASEQGVPPYVVFHDKTLREMADRLPADLPSLGAISGIGQAKLDKYGPQFLAVIQAAAV